MRDRDAPMTQSEFDEALALARSGGAMSDCGANDEVLDALSAIADSAPNAPPGMIAVAVDAFSRLSGSGPH